MRITNRFIGILIIILLMIGINYVYFNHEFPAEGIPFDDLDQTIFVSALVTWFVTGLYLVYFVGCMVTDEISFELVIPIPGTNLTKRKQLEKRITSVKKEIEKNKSRRHQYHGDRHFKDEAEEAEYAEAYEHFDQIVKAGETTLEQLKQELRECEE